MRRRDTAGATALRSRRSAFKSASQTLMTLVNPAPARLSRSSTPTMVMFSRGGSGVGVRLNRAMSYLTPKYSSTPFSTESAYCR